MQDIETPLVTVILTAFRRTTFLAQAIQSVVSQTLTSWECIVSDDANTFAAREICSRFSNDPRIRYRRNETTFGTPLNVAVALREARGQYVAILNDDDLLYPQMLERLVAALATHRRAVLAFGNHDVMDADGRILANDTEDLLHERGRVGLKPGMVSDSFGFAVRCGLMVGMGCVFRRSACDPKWLVSEVAGAYDYWLAIRISEQGGFFFVPGNVMAWRRHTDSVSSSVSPSIYASEIHIYETLAGARIDQPLVGYVTRRLAQCLFARGYAYLYQSWDVLEARNLLYRSWHVNWSYAAFRYWAASFLPSGARQLGIWIWHTMKVRKPSH